MTRWGYRRQNRHRLSKNGLWNLRPKRPIKASMQIKLLIFSGCIQQEPVKKYVIDYKYDEKKAMIGNPPRKGQVLKMKPTRIMVA